MKWYILLLPIIIIPPTYADPIAIDVAPEEKSRVTGQRELLVDGVSQIYLRGISVDANVLLADLSLFTDTNLIFGKMSYSLTVRYYLDNQEGTFVGSEPSFILTNSSRYYYYSPFPLLPPNHTLFISIMIIPGSEISSNVTIHYDFRTINDPGTLDLDNEDYRISSTVFPSSFSLPSTRFTNIIQSVHPLIPLLKVNESSEVRVFLDLTVLLLGAKAYLKASTGDAGIGMQTLHRYEVKSQMTIQVENASLFQDIWIYHEGDAIQLSIDAIRIEVEAPFSIPDTLDDSLRISSLLISLGIFVTAYRIVQIVEDKQLEVAMEEF